MNARRACGLAGGATLAGCSLVHVYWMGGGRRGAAHVIPATDGEPMFEATSAATGAVAAALAAAAVLYDGASRHRRPRWLYRAGTLGAATVLTARAIGDRRHLGFSKTRHDTAFARLDTTVLSPLCAGLAVAGLIAVTSPPPQRRP